jgi:prepilin-type N-terminal cleavage/methylation domain-containing protein
MLKMRDRRGFTLMEVVVVGVILTIIAAIVVPNAAGYYNQKRASDTVAILKSLSVSLNNPNGMAGDYGFLQTVLRYPLRLSHLTLLITTADRQCSGAVYTAAQVAAWRASPAYSSYNILPLQGVATPLGWIQDTVVKGTRNDATEPGSSPRGWVELHLDSLSTTDVQAIDLAVDGVVDSTKGIVRDSTARGTATSLNLHLLRFLVPAPLFRRSGATDSTTGCY